ncbi:hypothetical protein GCM10023219_29610 [Stakelama sediminis]|uniref:Spore germination cell wall hydrolase CwlJ-like protein n=1 Tax=Stakelama sediminis TaxID=463200 RepID=A0A840Z3D9_9SPHN|nr:cell wall hydrolase [Stakelama sediminis]MBB5720274.1 spore germination cell wall hydrolase CwlJ-like protein [Stakelama sediminis]
MEWRRFAHWTWHKQLAAIIASLLLLGFAAHAARASLDQIAPPAPPPAMPKGYEAEDHFPGALYFYVADDDAAPAPGVTGTTELPDQPVPAALDIDTPDDTITPARPFLMAGTPTDYARALQCLTTAIYYEGAREPTDGQEAIAQVILNRVRHPAFPRTVCGVVYQGSQNTVCQFSFACDGSLARTPERKYWDRAQKVAAAALAGFVFKPVGLATHYHTYAVRPAWAKTLVMTGVFGAHFFHRWKGWWGTAAAFDERYAGGEPVPGPHPRIGTPEVQVASVTSPAPPVPTALVPAPSASTTPSKSAMTKAVTASSSITAAYRDSGTPISPAADGSGLPQSQVLDKWKDSGKPLKPSLAGEE